LELDDHRGPFPPRPCYDSVIQTCRSTDGIAFSHPGIMFRKKKKKRPEISAPQNFEHRVHTSFDPKEGKFVGLPPQWQNILDTLRRPKPVVDPSRITRMQLQPMKVREGDFSFQSAGSAGWER